MEEEDEYRRQIGHLLRGLVAQSPAFKALLDHYCQSMAPLLGKTPEQVRREIEQARPHPDPPQPG